MSDTQEVSEHAASLADELDADVDEVEERLENLLEYSVPLEEAERTVRRRYGSEASEPDTAEATDIAELSPGDSRVSVEAVVLSTGRRRYASAATTPSLPRANSPTKPALSPTRRGTRPTSTPGIPSVSRAKSASGTESRRSTSTVTQMSASPTTNSTPSRLRTAPGRSPNSKTATVRSPSKSASSSRRKRRYRDVTARQR